MKKILFIGLLFSIILPNIAKSNFSLAGRILLQVEEKGQAWYVYPKNQTRYFLGTPSNAFQIMKELGFGISNNDLLKIPIGIPITDCLDSDMDGVCDNLENAIGTNKNNKDTDNDGYDDKIELDNGYNPLGVGKQIIDKNFTQKNSGKIFLQAEKNGEAWYIEPVSQKGYFLGRPLEAFQIMKAFGLGITNADLEKILIGIMPTIGITPNPATSSPINNENILQSAAVAIRESDIQKTLSYFTTNMHKSIEYSMQHMEKGNLLILANILSGSTMQSSTTNKKTYFNEVYFQEKKHPVYFYVEKQADGTWKITNL
jgi:hypothetical protein